MTAIKECGLENDFASHPLGELQDIQKRNLYGQETILFQKPSLKKFNASDYLSSVEPHIPSVLISHQNYREIKTLASYFTGGVTSFFGFETRLTSSEARADYLFAVSSQRGEREALHRLFTNGTLPETLLNRREWRNIRNFVTEWVNPHSPLYNNVLGLWFEFDTATVSSETPIPSIFIHSIPLRIDNPEDTQKCLYLTQTALPLLTGHPTSKKLETNIIHSIRNLPKNAVLFDVGVMFSRTATGVRLVIIRIQPHEIIPYLTSLGWKDENNGLAHLISELEPIPSRIVLHINITENGVDQKIGLECAYQHDQYNFETRWTELFDYLIEKNVCLPEKKAMLLNFLGVEQDDTTQKFNLTSYQTAVRIQENEYSSALVRYLSHIKLVYKPNQPMKAKAYLGVRLFGRPQQQHKLDII